MPAPSKTVTVMIVTRMTTSHRQHDLAELLAFAKARLRGRPILEWHHLVDDGLEPSGEEEAHDVVELLPIGHGRADDVHLFPEHQRDERLTDWARGRAAGDEPPTALERANGVLPR